jgi:hypothetical protein
MSANDETPSASGGSGRAVVKLVAAVAALGAALGMRPADAGAQVKPDTLKAGATATTGKLPATVQSKGAVVGGGSVNMKIGKEAVGGAVATKAAAGGAVNSKGATAAGAAATMKGASAAGGSVNLKIDAASSAKTKLKGEDDTTGVPKRPGLNTKTPVKP